MKVLILRYFVIISMLFLLNVLARIWLSELTEDAVSDQDIKKLSSEEAKEIVDIFLNNPTEKNFRIIENYIFPILEKKQREVPAWTEWVEQLISYCIEREEAYWIIEYEIFSDNLYMAIISKKLLEVSDGSGASVLLTILAN